MNTGYRYEDIVDGLQAAGDEDLPDRVKAHLPQAALAAEANLERAQSATRKLIPQLSAELKAAVGAQTPSPQRLRRVLFLAHQWSESLKPYSACRKGCSHCCYISTTISKEEALLLSKASGRPLSPAVRHYALAEQPEGLHSTGKACPFLKDGACSVYDSRPLVCRTLVNMDDTELLCELVEGAKVPVPYANALTLQVAHLKTVRQDEWADIRDWFAEETASNV